MRKAVTLAEVVFMLLIIGVIITCTIPIFKTSLGEVQKKQYTAAFNLAKDVSKELVYDSTAFPTGVLNNTSGKYCTEFAKKVNTLGSLTPNCTSSSVPDTPNFITTNSMSWYSTQVAFAANILTLYVNVDGPNKGANTTGDDILRIIVKDDGTVYAPLNSTECNYLGGNSSGNCQ